MAVLFAAIHSAATAAGASTISSRAKTYKSNNETCDFARARRKFPAAPGRRATFRERLRSRAFCVSARARANARARARPGCIHLRAAADKPRATSSFINKYELSRVLRSIVFVDVRKRTETERRANSKSREKISRRSSCAAPAKFRCRRRPRRRRSDGTVA